MSQDRLELGSLVERWVTGWAGVRRFPAPLRRPDGVTEVEVGRTDRRVELVVTEPTDDGLRAVAGEVLGTTDVWLTVASRVARDLPVPQGVVTLADDEALMRRRLARGDRGSRCDVEDRDGRGCATVWVDGVAAARGWAAVVGTEMVLDRVETDVAHRRRGLGSEVVGALETWALERGARDGLLVATVAGQGLYADLGWAVAGRFTTLGGSPT